MRLGQQFKATVEVGVPNLNTGPVTFKVCIYIKLHYGTWAQQQPLWDERECTAAITKQSSETGWGFYSTAPLTLSKGVGQNETLRAYITTSGNQFIAIDNFDIERVNPAGGQA